MKLQNKISLYVVVIVLLIGGAGAFSVLSIQRRASTHQFEDTASTLTGTILSGLEQDMLINERNHIQYTLDSMHQRHAVGEVDVISDDNRIWASTDRGAIGQAATPESQRLLDGGDQSIVNQPENDSLSVTEPIPVKDACLNCHGKIAPAPNQLGLLGAIRVEISTASFDQSLNQSRDVMIGLGALMFVLVAGTIVFLLRRLILKPLGALTGAAGRISRGDYSTRVPVSDVKSELGAVSSAFNDMINQVEEHTGQLQQTNLELERVNRMKSEFLANMSHELRTPLNVIIGFSEVLKDTPAEALSDDDRREFYENIAASGRHLLELINEVLDLAKVEAGQMRFVPEEFYVGPALSDIIASLQPLAAKKGIGLSVSVSDRLSSIISDLGKFKQIVYNLAGNAIKFTPAGGSVSVSARAMGKMARFAVTDTGVGIAAADQERIFSEFQQVDGSVARQHEGTGLGLALTRKFVELQGGRIWLESKPGVGSTFFFTLPLPASEERELPQAIPADRIETGPGGKDAGAPVSLDMPDAAGRARAARILVVEDDAKTAELIGLWLRNDGYEVDFAADGVEALEKAKALHPFAICLDVMLPRMDGWHVLRQLKSEPATANAGVIICSALDKPDLGFALGAADYCVKPLSRRPLLDKLRQLQLVAPLKRSRPQILVADSDPAAAAETEAILVRQGFSVIRAANSDDVWQMAMEHSPDIIILDMQISATGCYDVISMLRQHQLTVDIPVVLTASGDISFPEAKLMEGGAVGGVIRKEDDLRQELLDEIFRLEKFHPQQARLIDSETGLFNRRYFEKRLSQEIRRAKRYNLDLSVLMIQIDSGGDPEVNPEAQVAALTGVLRPNIRAADRLIRYDIKRFAVILTETTAADGIRVARKLVELVAASFHSKAGAGFRMTVSAAVADCHRGSVPPEQLMEKIDSALAALANEGGNGVRPV